MAIKHYLPTTPSPHVAERHDALRTALALADSQTPRDRRHLLMSADEARARMRADYFELPGLSLTVAQAARLWSVDEDLALAMLDELHAAGFLVCRDGQYARS